eukprot:gnl/TRDRNA2_/TRDRNA2_183807_c0_seq1.p1 gnl/TRDRNA2_/TRDRNA2_183807_c0~~gnl/TRDRNA2_/TRDRNA2_183807_c0_seq1.p1  ORF type:complete len:334 (+),score=67.76 gnl/TRDRNA2_/TRDRNA2_183807_c0_seq1:41-1042(+)
MLRRVCEMRLSAVVTVLYCCSIQYAACVEAEMSCVDEMVLLQKDVRTAKKAKPTQAKHDEHWFSVPNLGKLDIQNPKSLEALTKHVGKAKFGNGEGMLDILNEAHVSLSELISLVKDFMKGKLDGNALTSSLFSPAIEFKILDRDGNGVLNEQDINVIRDVVAQIPVPPYVSLMDKVFDQTRLLFKLCDGDQDGNTTKAEWLKAQKDGVKEVTKENEGGAHVPNLDLYKTELSTAERNSEEVFGGFKSLAKTFGFLNQDFLRIFKVEHPVSAPATAAVSMVAALLHHAGLVQEDEGAVALARQLQESGKGKSNVGSASEPTSLLATDTSSSEE